MVKSVLSFSWMYEAAQTLLGARDCRQRLVKEFIRPRPDDRILDIGCGPAAILDCLPEDVRYVGLDLSRRYIDTAKASYGARGEFHCLDVQEFARYEERTFDFVMAIGLLHHLPDDAATHTMKLMRSVLKPGGRFLTLDPVFIEGQNPVARMLLNMDRGEYVRFEKDYRRLAKEVFPDTKVVVRQDWIRLPYSHVFMSGTA